jgi:PhoH-like ATPase
MKTTPTKKTQASHKTTTSKIVKTFVLDTCTLIHDPAAIYAFEEHDVIIPLEVILELDRLKTESSERGKNARIVQRKLLSEVEKNGSMTESKLPTGGTLRIYTPNLSKTNKTCPILSDLRVSDHKILATAVELKELKKEKVVVVTKDMGMRLKARVLNIEAEDYLHDKKEEETSKNPTLEITSEHAAQFEKEGCLILKDQISLIGSHIYGNFSCEGEKNLRYGNWKHLGDGKLVKLVSKYINTKGGRSISVRNKEQHYFLDALLDPQIDSVSCVGKAGTGKTLITMAAALDMLHKNRFTGICIAKPNISVEKENGFLPGDLLAKLMPWLQPFADAVNFLYEVPKPDPTKEELQILSSKRAKSERKQENQPEGPRKKPFDLLIERGILEVMSIEHIRGRSIPNKVIIIDEAQNLKNETVKTISTRLGTGSKLIYLGDPSQIDSPYLDEFSNGLIHYRTRMQDLPNVRHLQLIKGERSLFCEQAAARL